MERRTAGASPARWCRHVLQDAEWARAGDLFMRVIHTCEVCGGNPFDYLTELQRHAAEIKQNPSAWMPWNYRATLNEAAMAQAA